MSGGPSPAEQRLFGRDSSANWGLVVAAGGFFAGSLLSGIGVAGLVATEHLAVAHGRPAQTPAVVVVGLVGLWLGLIGAAVVVSRTWGRGRLAGDFGLRLVPWPDIPLGIAVGLVSQFLLIPLFYLPLHLVVPHLDRTLAQPAKDLTLHAHGAGLAVLGLFVALGAPVVEELFFRGLVLRSLDRRLSSLGPRLAPVLAILLSAAVFGLAHGEGLVIGAGLALFGVVLAVMAERLGRLGAGIVAHMTFNAATVVALAFVR